MTDYGITARIENDRELVLEKIFEGPIEKVFNLFSKTEHLEHFWAPHGWELIHSFLEFEPGGEWFYGMKSTNGNPQMKQNELWGKSTFEKIERPYLIETIDYFADKKGEINRELPASKTTTKFVELDKNRIIIVSRREFNSPEELQELINQGMRETIAERWEQLSKYVASLS